jgi:hypothetical protein
MLVTLIVVLVLLWALGLIGGYAMGGLIHVLLVAALVVVAFRLFSGRRISS